MKKIISLLLCLALVFGLSACSDGYKTDKKAKAEDIFAAAMQNLATTAKNLLNADAEATQLSFTIKGNVAASLDMSAAGAGKFDITGKVDASGLADNKKGASVSLKAETDAMKALAPLLGALLGNQSAEDLKYEAELYLDLEGKRSYAKDSESGKWSYKDFDPADLKKVDTKSLDEIGALTLDKVFETHTFTVEKEQYVLEGTIKVDAFNTANLPVKDAAEMMAMIKDLKPTMKLTINTDKKITSQLVSVKDYTLDLSKLGAPMSVVLKELNLEFGIKYEAVSFSVPADVKSGATADR